MKIVMIGATGAVGTEVVKRLLVLPALEQLTLLGRRIDESISESRVTQHVVDLMDVATYQQHLGGHTIAVCTVGVGQPSAMSREQFVRIDRTLVFDFATACRKAGIEHFQLLSSVGVSPDSRSFFLRSKGELQRDIESLGMVRVSFFQPSMILTEQNRYGFSQWLTLAVWPFLGRLMPGPLQKFRGIPVAELGIAMANNVATTGNGVEILQWADFKRLTRNA